MLGIHTIFIILHMLSICNGQQLKNVLFVVTDDMRPDIGVYTGEDNTFYKDIITPNLDKFSETSLTFTRAYAQIALCAPSRTSFMTGRRPDTTLVYDLDTYWREAGGNFTTVAQYFKENGYITINSGKIFQSGEASGKDDREYSWSETPYREGGYDMWETKEYSWQAADPELNELYPQRDTMHTDYAIDKMRELAPAGISGEQPFFLAVGFNRPHLPFVAARQFYDLYADHDIDIASNPHVPENLHNLAYSSWGELRSYDDVDALGVTGDYNTTVPDYFAIDLRRAYYATISYVDSLFGQLVDELDTLGLTENTVVVFFSDHGYQLGEHSEWCKHTNFEVAAQVPLMMRWPGMANGGTSTPSFVELVDLFPTLVEASGLEPVPLCPLDSSDVLVCHEGQSLVALDGEGATEWKDAAFFQYPRLDGTKMGYAIRTQEYQYVRWVDFRGIPQWNNLHSEELYDLAADIDMNFNVAVDEQYASVVAELNEKLQAGWREALPN